MTAETFMVLIQRLRAFVRPTHGECFVVRHDQLPSLTSHDFTDFVHESSVERNMSPPYVHEYVGEAEAAFGAMVFAAEALV